MTEAMSLPHAMLNRVMLAAAVCALGLLPVRPGVANLSDPNAVAADSAPAAALKARPLPLSSVRLLDGPFQNAFEADMAYLLSFDPERQLVPFRAAAGLPVEAARYGGWNRSGLNLGHYLVAACHAWKVTGDPELRRRIDRLLAGLLVCQDARGDGHVSGMLETDALWSKVLTGAFEAQPLSLEGRGCPFYAYHKLFDGLLHVHRATGDARALRIAARFADWIDTTFAPMPERQFQHLLVTEQGGMVEALLDLYAATEATRYLALAKRFRHQAVLEPLSQRRDALAGRHGNSTVVKLLGEARLYEMTGAPEARVAASYFLRQVIEQHCYAHGGYTDGERFGRPGQLAARMGHQSAETCKTYNLLKLLRHVYAWEPDAKLFDYYETALYNHILASIDPSLPGAFVYYMTVRPGDMKVYSRPYDNFWCCVSTGQESHVKAGESIYWEDAAGLWVNLFIPSEATWGAKGVVVRQETRFPAGDTTTFRLKLAEPVAFVLRLRCPHWLAAGAVCRVNGIPVAETPAPGTYLTVERTWQDGDVVDMALPRTLRTVPMPDLATRRAVMHGPILLAADLGPVTSPPWEAFHLSVSDPTDPRDWPIPVEIPVLATGGRSPADWLDALPDRPGCWRTRPFVAWRGPVTFVPLYELHHRRMALYLDTVETDGVLDLVRVGDPYSEYVRHQLRGENHDTGPGPKGVHWRHSHEGWFAYDLTVRGDRRMRSVPDLVVTYWGGDHSEDQPPRRFTILVDGEPLAEESLTGERPGQFLERRYRLQAIPRRARTEIRFRAHPGTVAGGVYGLRLELPRD